MEVHLGGTVHRCESLDLGAGGCRVVVPARVERGTPIWIRLSSAKVAGAVEGDAVVAWASADLPCRMGIQFSDEVAEQIIPFIRELLGPVPIHTGR